MSAAEASTLRGARTHKHTFSSTSWEEIMDEEEQGGSSLGLSTEEIMHMLNQGTMPWNEESWAILRQVNNETIEEDEHIDAPV